MKLSTYVTTALVGLAGLAATASAQSTISAADGDLFLGFYATSGTGVASNLEVDLGSISTYTTTLADGNLHSISKLSAADLSSTYGASWNTRSDLFWGAAGWGGQSTNAIIYATKVESTLGTMSTPYDIQSKGARGTAKGSIQSLATALNGFTSTTNSAFSAVVATSDGSSWSSLANPSSTVDFSLFDTTAFDNTTNIANGSYSVSDLYLVGNGVVTYVGSLGLKSDGSLWYSSDASDFATAVPEPATYAAIIGALALGAVVIRRRRQAAAA